MVMEWLCQILHYIRSYKSSYSSNCVKNEGTERCERPGNLPPVVQLINKYKPWASHMVSWSIHNALSTAWRCMCLLKQCISACPMFCMSQCYNISWKYYTSNIYYSLCGMTLFGDILWSFLCLIVREAFLLQYLRVKLKCISFFRMANERGLNWSQYSPVIYSVDALPVPPLYIFLRLWLSLKDTKSSAKFKVLCCRLSTIWVFKNIWGEKKSADCFCFNEDIWYAIIMVLFHFSCVLN